jgi:hypothetical protein
MNEELNERKEKLDQINDDIEKLSKSLEKKKEVYEKTLEKMIGIIYKEFTEKVFPICKELGISGLSYEFKGNAYHIKVSE